MLKAKLVVVGGDAKAAEVQLNLPTIIGRGREVNLTLPHPLVSRQHCELFERDGKLLVRDLKSLNGTYVDSQKIQETEILKPDQLLTIGNVTFRAVYANREESIEETEMRSTTETVAADPEHSVIEIENVASSESDSKIGSDFDQPDSIHSRPTQPGKRHDKDVLISDVKETIDADVLVQAANQSAMSDGDVPVEHDSAPEHSVCAAMQNAGVSCSPGDATISDIQGELPEPAPQASNIKGLSSIHEETPPKAADSFKGIQTDQQDESEKIQAEESALGSFIRKLPR